MYAAHADGNGQFPPLYGSLSVGRWLKWGRVRCFQGHVFYTSILLSHAPDPVVPTFTVILRELQVTHTQTLLS